MHGQSPCPSSIYPRYPRKSTVSRIPVPLSQSGTLPDTPPSPKSPQNPKSHAGCLDMTTPQRASSEESEASNAETVGEASSGVCVCVCAAFSTWRFITASVDRGCGVVGGPEKFLEGESCGWDLASRGHRQLLFRETHECDLILGSFTFFCMLLGACAAARCNQAPALPEGSLLSTFLRTIGLIWASAVAFDHNHPRNDFSATRARSQAASGVQLS